ncbi:MAG: DNA polymerase I [Actinobacteria bacterium]|nr:DNA polymerase I [Actinomycetota bacterium]
MDRNRKIILIDGHSLAYRAFFALPDTLTTSSGQQTNAVYGFLSMLLKVMEEEKPDAVVVALDGPRRELKRVEEYPEYKANRPPTPEEFIPQVEMVRELLSRMKIPALQLKGVEADDILGTIAKRVARQGNEAVIVTGDRDTLQLVEDGITVMMTGKGITETTSYDTDAVVEKLGIPPESIPDYLGLKGDSSDNIPGVSGIGEKGASSLIEEFGNLEGLYENLEKISGKRKAVLEENREIAFLSKQLATIDCDLDIELDMGELNLGDWELPEVLAYMDELEFRTLSRRFRELFPGEPWEKTVIETEAGINYRVVKSGDGEDVDNFLKEIEREGKVAVSGALSGSGYCDVELQAIALAGTERLLIVERSEFDGAPAMKAAVRILESLEIEKWFHDAKPSIQALEKIGINAKNISFDTAIAAYLDNPSQGSYDIWDVWEKCVGKEIFIDDKPVVEEEQATLSLWSEDLPDEKLGVQAARIMHLKPVLESRIMDQDMGELFNELEMPLMKVLCEMEKTGVAIDRKTLNKMSENAKGKISLLEREIFETAGHEFNIGSPKQLAAILFDEMGIAPVKKTKTGYSTDSSVLEALKNDHEIAAKVLDYRTFTKLKSTYLDALPGLICPATGRIHSQLNQTVAATGRISSSNPNLQNIPIRSEFGKEIRTAFIPGEPGWRMLVADYSQIELRVLAHMSDDDRMIEAFREGADIHNETASMVFGVDPENVTSDQRRIAKMVNFGVVYGMSNYGLSARLGIPLEEASFFINAYFERFSGAKEFQEKCIKEAEKKGYVETMMGRKRYIPEITGRNRQVKEFGERMAINTPIQGSAADIIKKAMVDVGREMDDRELKSKMTLQVHDELIFDVVQSEVDQMKELVSRLMTEAAELKVPLIVDIGVYDNWGEAK